MLQRWHSLSFLLVLLWSGFGWAEPFFENSAIVRTVELGGSLVHITTTYAVKALEPGQSTYHIALSTKDREKTSWLEVKIKGQQVPLPVEELGKNVDSQSHLFKVTLPQKLDVNATLNLVLETIQTHATYPWPERAAQSDSQSMKYESELFVLSPYFTTVQRTKIRASTPNIIFYTTPDNLEEFTMENPVTKSGTTLTYGPFNNFAPSTTSDFVLQHQKPITIHYEYDQPVLVVKTLERAAEISHWGANLNIENKIDLSNAGPTLKGQFSRIDYQSQTFFRKTPAHIVPSLTLHLPAGIRDTYFYDLIGNVSTSHLRTAPSVPKHLRGNQYSILEMRPRYPIMGGWNYSFTLGWDAPLEDSVSWDASRERYIAAIPLMTLIPGAVVNDAEIKIILPEAATDVEFVPPYPALSSNVSTHTTYIDTVGRPAILLHYSNLTDKHTGMIYVSYKVPMLAHLRKPVAVALAFFGLFTLALVGRRIDLRIQRV